MTRRLTIPTDHPNAIAQLQLKKTPVAFVVLYGLSFLFDNLGANTTTFVVRIQRLPRGAPYTTFCPFFLDHTRPFIVSQTPTPTQIPAEIFPTEARATCHGISAAFGKAGAALGAAVFLRLINSQCPNHVCTKDSPPEDVDRGVK